ncbi:S-malonyltransferase [Capsaspora owczarzaki ATCC 30864]|uniref:S-malonyltransferase n=1 Tax=Capsaspora owczarzaki (strain ATCC 30864) TaxID=595528 RepID=UPI0003521210|nr:S-malonyltransferase [Capsaspora owczarzaki ATCC 30864]|eukprot:XP_004349907.2 S-malonyltransferase [Capsaspora owczarzaki ATCC 30864]
MGKDLADAHPVARRTFDEVDAALNDKLSHLMFNGPLDKLTLTANAQPAILAHSIALLRVIEVVLSGSETAVARVVDAALFSKVARRSVDLNISAPFHSRWMAPAADALRQPLGRIKWRDPMSPVISNVTAAECTVGEEWVDLLLRQVTAPVLWSASVSRAVNHFKITNFVELGGGTTLKGLISQIDPLAVTKTTASLEELELLIRDLNAS